MMVKKKEDSSLQIALGAVVVGVVIGIVGCKLSAWSQMHEARGFIQAALPATTIDSVKPSPIFNLNEVVAGNNRFYADNQGRYLVFGHIYDVKTRQDLTQDVISSPKPNLAHLSALPDIQNALPTPTSGAEDNDGYININTLPSVNDAIQTGMKGGIPIVVFLDPDCPYCQALQSELAMQNQALSVREYLMPIPELHPDAPLHAKAIWCSGNPEDALNNYMVHGKLAPLKDCDVSALERIHGFANQQNFQATPTLVRADGAIYQGYMPYNQLVTWAKTGLNNALGGTHG